MSPSYFIGKYCTIITTPINRAFKEEYLLQYFTGIVEAITDEGVFLKQLTGNLKTMIMAAQVIAIAEEQVETDENKIKEFKNTAEVKTPKPVTMEVQKELNIQAMQEASKLLKQAYGKKA